MATAAKKKVQVKVGMLGDVQVGKTTLMCKYVEGKFQEDYIMTLGLTFMQKTLDIKGQEVSLVIFDQGGQKEFISMLDLLCADAHALFFMFDLSRKSSLANLKQWYIEARKLNTKAIAFLIGTKYDKFVELPKEEQEEITLQARKYAEKMKSPLVFVSSQAGVNVNKLFKLVIAKVFKFDAGVEKISGVGEPILEF